MSIWLPTLLLAITCVSDVQMRNASPFKHLRSKRFSMIWRTSQVIEFWPMKSLFEVLGVHRDSISQSGSCLGSVRVHSFTFFYILRSMWCDSWAFSWLAPLQPLGLGREPKAKVATNNINNVKTKKKGKGGNKKKACCRCT